MTVRSPIQKFSAGFFQKHLMSDAQPNNPLHGVTLETMLNHLVEQHGWEDLGRRIPIKCFMIDPSIKSSLKFLRKTPWARKKVEELFLRNVQRPR